MEEKMKGLYYFDHKTDFEGLIKWIEKSGEKDSAKYIAVLKTINHDEFMSTHEICHKTGFVIDKDSSKEGAIQCFGIFIERLNNRLINSSPYKGKFKIEKDKRKYRLHHFKKSYIFIIFKGTRSILNKLPSLIKEENEKLLKKYQNQKDIQIQLCGQGFDKVMALASGMDISSSDLAEIVGEQVKEAIYNQGYSEITSETFMFIRDQTWECPGLP